MARLIICGGGHIGRALAPIAHGLGFAVMVLDSRVDFATRDNFPMAAALLPAPYEVGLESIQASEEDYYVVITHGHEYDALCVKIIVDKPHVYLGMIGSRSKVADTWRLLSSMGTDPAALEKVYAPIGLPLGGDHPMEVALSIAAQLVMVRNGLQKDCKPPRIPGVLAVISATSGSTPRGEGAWLVVTKQGDVLGTVGGGALEEAVIERARRMVVGRKREDSITYDLSQGGALGMACGGTVTVAFTKVKP